MAGEFLCVLINDRPLPLVEFGVQPIRGLF
jgi:hypothetical protein